MKQTKVAIIYDFDKTLSTDDMQAFGFIQGLGMEVNDFWNDCSRYSKANNVESILTYMYLMVKYSKEKGKPITKEYLNSCGKKVKLFNGVKEWFDRINAYGKKMGVEVEHYVISSGLKEIIEGTEIADKFKQVYAGSFVYENGVPVWPALSLNYTNKTQFLYRINKGCLDILDRSVNEEMSHSTRPIPFSNMIYIGDSETDIPCMRLTVKNGGTAIGLYQSGSKNESYLRDLLKRNRISFVAKADYTENGELDTVIKGMIKSIKAKSDLEDIKTEQKELEL
jgi:2-hydroxy-3-keto-5-methylthiopentenyl-1-phosphate phosphatase